MNRKPTQPDDLTDLRSRLERATALICRIQEAQLGAVANPLQGGTALLDDAAEIVDTLREAERLLRRQSTLLNNVNDNTTELIFMKDLRGRLTYCNRATLEAMGLTHERAIGSDNDVRFSNLDEAPAIEANDRHVADTGETIVVEETYTCANGKLRVFQSTKSPLREEATGKIVGVIGVSRDITDRKRADDLLQTSQEELKESDRLKDEFLATLAHELRNPLAPIRTGLELLGLAGNTAESVERVRTMMVRQVGHMVGLVDDLLDVSRVRSGKIQLKRMPTALSDLLTSAIEANHVALNAARIELTVRAPDQPLILDVDPRRMVQVVSNLLNNAAKFTSAGGHIEVCAQWNPTTTDAAEGQLELSVADDGIGIATEMLPRVFDLFIQGEQGEGRTQSGLGIGLALARRLVEMHGGRIEATSPGIDQGSKFAIHLPVTRQVSGEEVPHIASEVHPVSQRVLIIDDHDDTTRMMEMMMEKFGAETRVAHDGLAGVRLAREFRPDVVLLDIGMPRIDGYETCRRLRMESFGSDLFIVALTGWGQEQDKTRALQAGFSAHLTKPVDPAVLKRVLVASSQTASRDPLG